MVFLQFLQFSDRRLLKHAFEHSRRMAVEQEDTMVFRHLGVEPESVAHDIRLWHGLERLVSADEHVSTHHHGVEPVGGTLHHALKKRKLKFHKVLIEPLSPLPSIDGHRQQELSRRCVGRQSAALSSAVDEDAFLFCEPLVERDIRSLAAMALFQQPCSTPTASEPIADRVAGGIELPFRQFCDLMKAVDDMWWKRKEFLHNAKKDIRQMVLRWVLQSVTNVFLIDFHVMPHESIRNHIQRSQAQNYKFCLNI